jgi:hypothetical protein
VSNAQPLQLWQALTSGAWKVDESVAPDGQLGLRLRPAKAARPIWNRDAAVLKHWLVCGRVNVVAKWFGISRSHVVGIVDASLKRMGFCGLPSQVPVIFAVAARADAVSLDCLSIEVHEDGFASVAVDRDDAWLAALSASEKDAVRGLLDGETREVIAARRGTSSRTIANQLCAAFRKLKVSTVGELRAACARIYVEKLTPRERAA